MSDMNLVTLTQTTSAAAEAYRTLRTNLLFAGMDAPLKTVLIASPDDATDAATTLANPAVTLAQSERRVLAVDANLRAPSLHALFELPNNAGLADLLTQAAPDAPSIRPTQVPGLSVLTSGQATPNAADLLSSGRMDAVLKQLANMCDIVLVCAPPLTAYSDAAVLASKVDGTLLAVRAGKTRRDEAQKAKDTLARAHARLLGAVLLNA